MAVGLVLAYQILIWLACYGSFKFYSRNAVLRQRSGGVEHSLGNYWFNHNQIISMMAIEKKIKANSRTLWDVESSLCIMYCDSGGGIKHIGILFAHALL